MYFVKLESFINLLKWEKLFVKNYMIITLGKVIIILEKLYNCNYVLTGTCTILMFLWIYCIECIFDLDPKVMSSLKHFHLWHFLCNSLSKIWCAWLLSWQQIVKTAQESLACLGLNSELPYSGSLGVIYSQLLKCHASLSLPKKCDFQILRVCSLWLQNFGTLWKLCSISLKYCLKWC